MIYFLVKIFNKIKTPFRRVYHPEVKRGFAVIDIGSGGTPYPRASVLCDFIEEDFERNENLKVDRPFVWANIENLPFKNKAFDYSIVSHVLEHAENPKKALEEIQRISKGGYIETPNAFHEFTIPYPSHVSRCSILNGKLIVTMKKNWNETLEGYEDVKNDMLKNMDELRRYDSLSLFTIYKWKNIIDYEVRGNLSDKPREIIRQQNFKVERPGWKNLAMKISYLFLRPKKINLKDVLACPKCKGILNLLVESADCLACGSNFKKFKGFFDFRI